ncbi:MAG: hypothetical protein IK120_02170 [Muribaculaceae bacterium]|nr:hypothetical protein [Muribaculaceae bacterium]
MALIPIDVHSVPLDFTLCKTLTDKDGNQYLCSVFYYAGWGSDPDKPWTIGLIECLGELATSEKVRLPDKLVCDGYELTVYLKSACAYNQHIRAVYIPQNTIAGMSFAYTRITQIVICASTPPTCGSYYGIPTFYGMDTSKCIVYVPYGSKSDYEDKWEIYGFKEFVECDPEEKWQEILNED